MTRSFVEVSVRLPADLAEAAELALIEAGADGTAQELRGAESAEVIGYFTRGAPPEPAALREQVRAWCRRAPGAALEVEARARPWEDWVTRTREILGPTRATHRLWITPPWASPPAGSREVLVIEPGQAFGVGTHDTTRGCLELLESVAGAGRGGPTLDIGTGTGILALRAIQLGFAPVVACDTDPLAVADARRNARHCGLEPALALFAGEACALRSGARFALILANLFLNPLLALTPFFAERLAGDGRLIVSGFRAEDAPELRRTLAAAGLVTEREVLRNGWVAAGLRRG
jgi:ribosomal protein L11 methyltransferase